MESDLLQLIADQEQLIEALEDDLRTEIKRRTMATATRHLIQKDADIEIADEAINSLRSEIAYQKNILQNIKSGQ